MPSLADTLNERLAAVREQGLHRELRRIDSPSGPRMELGGRTFLNFSSNDYLGLASHPALKEAAIKGVEKWGAGAGASRLICGSLGIFHELEAALAAFKMTEAALAFSTGYAAALGTITALAGKDDILILDKLVHASIVDAARLSGAKLRVFAHNNLDDLEDKLQWAALQAAPFAGGPSPGARRHRERFQHGWRHRAAAGNRRPQGTVRRLADGGRGARHRRHWRERARAGRMNLGSVRKSKFKWARWARRWARAAASSAAAARWWIIW